MRNIILPALIVFFFQSCNNKPNQTREGQAIDTAMADTLNRGVSYASQAEEYADENSEEPALHKETRLKFPGFTLVFHDFRGYGMSPEHDDSRIPEAGIDTAIAVLNNAERYYENTIADANPQEKEDYVEALIVKKDTIPLDETFDQISDTYPSGNGIFNTLIQVIPANTGDKFKLSFCYLTSLNEIIDDRNHAREELDKLYKDALHFKESTPYYPVRDSAGLYFKALTYGEDNHCYSPDELSRIKKKYHLKDTAVTIPGEYVTSISLTKDRKLFTYDYSAYLFRIERFSNNKPADTKYIIVYMFEEY